MLETSTDYLLSQHLGVELMTTFSSLKHKEKEEGHVDQIYKHLMEL